MSAEVVVGVGGTGSSENAVRWGAEQAAVAEAELVLLHAVGHRHAARAHARDDAAQAAAQQMLAREEARARHEWPDLKVRTETSTDTAARCLTARSSTAQLLVLGTHRLGPAQRVFSGSAAYQVVAGAHCPVAVVPPLHRLPEGVVVVGVDGSAESAEALQVAAREAVRTGSVLEVVHAWQDPRPLWDVRVPPDLGSSAQPAEQHLLESATAGLEEQHPGLEVRRRLVREQPAAALLEAAAAARLLVVGSRGLHGVPRVLLGSTSHAVVLHAPCPVLVVRA